MRMEVRTIRASRWCASATLAVCLVVALEAATLASSGVSENVPVPGGLSALARALDIDAPDRARCVVEIVRLVYGDMTYERSDPASPYRRLIGHLSVAASAASEPRIPDLVPVPLTASLWSRAVFRRDVTSQTLFAAIVSDSDAALLAHGLSALDDETLEWFADHPALLTTLYRRHAIVFASFAAHLRIHNGRVLPPGGDGAVPLWESVLGARVSDPMTFVTALFTSAKGRMAYLYDVIGQLDGPRAAFALGLWLPDRTVRLERFQALSQLSVSAIREWNAARIPFFRPVHDLLALLNRVRVERTGAPAFPASRGLWAEAMSARGDGFDQERTSPGDDGPIDAAWLGAVILSGPGLSRRDRLDQFAFGHRVFASAKDAASPDLIAAIGSFRRVPMLMLTVERMELRHPSVYAALARHAEQLTRLDPIQQQRSLAQFQGAVALLARMVHVQTIDRTGAERLLETLASASVDKRRGYAGGIAPWLLGHVGPMISAGANTTLEETIVQALAGRPSLAPAAPVSWEGKHYVFDLHESEASRIRRYRQRGSVSSLDAIVQLHELATQLAAGEIGLDPSGDTLAEVRVALAKLPNTARLVQQLAQPWPRSVDVARVLFDAVDVLTADALVSFAYAIEWSDPPGPARLDRDLPRRHYFGLTAAGNARTRTAWALPRLVFPRGEPWHVAGAVLGLDVALAPLALRKIDVTPPPGEPRILSTHQRSFLISLGLLNVFTLRDVEGPALAEAVARGQRRVDGLNAAPDEATGVIDEIAMDGWRARALRWSLVHAPESVSSLFSLTELLHLGGGGQLDVHAWGMSALDAFGCLCTLVPRPGIHTALAGRDSLGLLPVAVPDLNLRVAIVLGELGLPAALAKHVLGAALHEFLRDVSPAHSDDWVALVRHARGLSRERIEDYLGAVAASEGPLLASPTARRLP
jgi:hypothetical protein